MNNERLAACAAVHRLHAPLRHFSQQLLADVTAFLDGLRRAAAPAVQAAAPQGTDAGDLSVPKMLWGLDVSFLR